MIKIVCFSCVAAALFAFAGCATAPKPKTLADGKSHFASLGTNKVHYVTVGGGRQTIVFVHCWAGNLGFWREQVPAFADKARLVLIDLPGHGQSDKPHTAYTMDFFASAVLAVMRDAHVDKATLVGHSMGGAVICLRLPAGAGESRRAGVGGRIVAPAPMDTRASRGICRAVSARRNIASMSNN